MKTFWSLFKDSTIIQGLITLVVVGAVVYLVVVGRPVDEPLASWGGLVIGFYFGTKFQQAMLAAASKPAG